jgi:hypothetical protein
MNCDFKVGQALSNIRVPAADCGSKCVSKPECTHFAWNNYNGGTFDAVGVVCGVVPG